MSRAVNWPYVRQNAWRFQGGEKWSREMGPLEVFIAQSNASGLRRVLAIWLVLTADAIFDHIAHPLLHRGMKGERLGVDATRLSVTAMAWRASEVALDVRGWLEMQANRLGRYNS